MSRWHPSVEEIDDAIDADLTTSTRGRVIARHLGQCDQCTAIRSSLLDTRAQLRALGQEPLPLPPGWDETVATALIRAREQGIDEPGRGRSRRRWYALAASAALLLGVGGVLAPQLIEGAETGDRSVSEAAATSAPSTRVSGSDAPASEEQPATAVIGGPAGVSISSGTNYLPVTVGRQMREQLAAAQAQPDLGERPELDADRLDTGLAGRCTELMRLGIGSRPDDATVRLVDQAQWQGEPAVIVVTDAASGNGMDVWVMPAKCMGEQPVAKVADVAAN